MNTPTIILTPSADFVLMDENLEKYSVWSICLSQYKKFLISNIGIWDGCLLRHS